ncbi:MAG: hypothetical protein RL154_680 [Pseudomonadota bacterium]
MNKNTTLLPLLFLCLAYFGAIADNSVVANSLSPIALDLKASMPQMQFANIAYSLIAVSIMLTVGFLGARFGWKKVLLSGFLIVTIGEFITYISQDIYTFTYIGRIAVGIGASMAVTAAFALIPIIYTGNKTAAAFSAIAASAAVASFVAPAASGIIIMDFGWRISFLILTIMFAASFIGAALTIKIDEQINNSLKFDFIGFIALFIGASGLIYGISQITNWVVLKAVHAPFLVFGLSPTLFVIFVSLLILAFYGAYQSKREEKYGMDSVFISKEFFKDIGIKASIVLNGFKDYVTGAIMFIVVLYLQVVMGASALQSGLALGIFSIGMVITASFTMKFTSFSPKTLSIFGIALSSIAPLIIMLGIEEHSLNAGFFIGMFMLGFGLGIISALASYVATITVKDISIASKSSGAQGAARNFGQAIGVAILGLVLLVTLESSVKNKINASNIPQTLKSEVNAMPNIAFVSDKELQKELNEKNVDAITNKTIIDINTQARLYAIRTTMLLLAISSIIFIFFIFSLPSKSIKDMRKY